MHSKRSGQSEEAVRTSDRLRRRPKIHRISLLQGSFFRSSSVQLSWNCGSTGLFVLVQSDVDKTNQSYYGESKLNYLTTDGSYEGLVPLRKEGHVHDVQWSYSGSEFVVVYGYMPAKATVFDKKCNPLLELGTGPYNCVLQYPRTSDEHVPLSSHCGPSSGLFTGLLVDTNLDTSSPDAYRSPPAPIPYDVSVGHPNTPLVTQEICVNKNDAVMQTTNSDSVQEAGGGNNQDPPANTKELEVELSKSVDSVGLTTEEEDACPICLEEYDVENPKLMTKCEHHFHLACILEWMERSEICPVCDQEMMFDPPIDS